MSDDEHTDAGPADDESESTPESGAEIPISTGGEGEDEGDVTNATDGDDGGDGDGDGADSGDDGVEIDVETGSPGPDVERRPDESTEVDRGGSGAESLFERLDRTLVGLLSRGLGTETHVRVYLAVRRRPWSTPEQVAEEAGLYPQAARDALETLEARGVVSRRGPAGDANAGTASETDEDGSADESEYAAVEPSDVLTDVVGGRDGGLPDGLDLDLDRYFGAGSASDDSPPIRIDVEEIEGERTERDTTTDEGSAESEASETDDADEDGGRESGDESE